MCDVVAELPEFSDDVCYGECPAVVLALVVVLMGLRADRAFESDDVPPHIARAAAVMYFGVRFLLTEGIDPFQNEFFPFVFLHDLEAS